jgi:hypothetical protein
METRQDFATVIMNNSNLRVGPAIGINTSQSPSKSKRHLLSSEAIPSQSPVSATQPHHQVMDDNPHAFEIDLDLDQEKVSSSAEISSSSAKEGTADSRRKEFV